MDAKGIAILLIFLFFGLPSLIGISIWAIKVTHNPSPENVASGVQMAVEDQIPWWIKPLQWLAGLGTVGAVLIIGFMGFLKWTGEI